MKGGAHLFCVVLLLCSGYRSPASRVFSDEDDERQRNFKQFQDKTERDAPRSLQVNENDDEQLESLNNGEDDVNENEEDDNEQAADDTETRLGNVERENERHDELNAVDETPKAENDDSAFFRFRRWGPLLLARIIGTLLQIQSCSTTLRLHKGCELISYSGTNFGGKTARIHCGFNSAMDRIDKFAGECSVKIYVTSSFRKKNVKLTGTVVPPASRSNHFIGHAIDMNVKYNNGFCNSRCLGRPKRPPPVFCFIKKIREDKDLRWGGDFKKKDTVHIDDGYNVGLTTRHQYKDLYAKLQRSCK